MKRIQLLFLAITFFCTSFSINSIAQNVAINTDGSTPDESAMLDIVNSAKGLLIPRVSLTSTTDATTITTPATSLLIYNTNAFISGAYAAGAGYYYNAGTTVVPSWRRLVGDGETRWDDLRVTLDKGSNSAALDYLSGSSGPQIWYFRNNQGVESMSFTVQLPHSWKEGTTIYPHLHWTPRSSGTGNVEWNFEYTWANYDETTPQVFPAITTNTVLSTGPFTANTHNITALSASNNGIVATGKKISSILICRIWRNSGNTADTYNSDAGVLFVDFHIQIDSWGSREEYIK
ncbi:MAG TPA: hypothetical protein PKA77_03830 [Chitinophagaceae bacterium]|jgi:hypothetical protein|nr:hypothetical protein [Chitinophagaceae bacterium]HMU57506.1 hypothetical protein [Chitinophagaceae bacterium]